MRLSMITRRDLLRLDMVMVVIATSMSTDLTLITRLRFIIHRHITMDMVRGLLSLVMALLMSMLSRRTMDMATQSLMNMDTTFIKDQLNQDMVMTMDMATQSLMNMGTTFIKDQLNHGYGFPESYEYGYIIHKRSAEPWIWLPRVL